MSTFSKCISLLVRGERLQVIFLSLASLVVAAMEAFGVALIIPLVQLLSNEESLKAPGFVSTLYRFLGVSDVTLFIQICVSAFMVFFVMKAAILITVQWWRVRFSQIARLRISTDLLGRYINEPYLKHINRSTPQLIRNLTSSASVVFGNVIIGYIELFAEVMIVISLFLVMFYEQGSLTLSLLLLMLPPLVLLVWLMRRRVVRLGRHSSDAMERILREITHAISAMKEIKMLGCENYFISNFQRDGLVMANSQVHYQVMSNAPRQIIELVAICSVCFIILLSTANGTTNEIIAVISLYAAATFKLIPSAGRIIQLLNNIRFSAAFVDDIYSDMVEPGEEMEHNPGSVDRKIGLRDGLELKGVSFTYPGTTQATVDGIDLFIPRGSTLGVVGGSGAGKTTMANHILGLIPPDQGAILADGTNIWSDIRRWRRQIGFVAQSFQILDEDIRRNVAFGLRDEEINDDQVQRALEQASLWSFVQTLPAGIHTRLGENAVRLSGGQRQRIAIARALYNDPDILLLDEATSALDNETETEVTQAINALSGKKTLIVIAHRLSTVKHLDRICFMRAGRVIQVAPFDQLMDQNEEFRRMVLAAERSAEHALP